jgi:hypothetical protein
MNGMRPDLIDGSGTINPAALNSSGNPSSFLSRPIPLPSRWRESIDIRLEDLSR